MMNLATIVVTGVYANARRYATIPAGIVGATVTFEFTDPIWEGLTKTAVFQGSATRDVVMKGNTVTVPQEVVDRAGPMLKVGVYGVDAEKNLVVPTLWAAIGGIRDAADPSGDPGTDPELPIWAQLAAEVEKLKLHGGATDEQIQKAVSDYLQKNPIEKLTEEELVAAIKAYFEKNPIDVGSDVCVVYVVNNPAMSNVILTSKTSDEIFDAWLNAVPIYCQYDADGARLVLSPLTIARDKCVFSFGDFLNLGIAGTITIEGDIVTDQLTIEKAYVSVTSQIINGNVVYSANVTSDEIFNAYEQHAEISCRLNVYGANVELNLVACNENLAVFSNSIPAVQDLPGIGVVIVISGKNVSYYEWEVVTKDDLPTQEQLEEVIKKAVDEALKDRPGSGGNVDVKKPVEFDSIEENKVYTGSFPTGVTLNGYNTYNKAVTPGEVYYITSMPVENKGYGIAHFFNGDTFISLVGEYPATSGMQTDFEVTVPGGATLMRVIPGKAYGQEPVPPTMWQWSNGSPTDIALDTTLTQSGKAADAKAVGDKIAELSSKIEELCTEETTKIYDEFDAIEENKIYTSAFPDGYTINGFTTYTKNVQPGETYYITSRPVGNNGYGIAHFFNGNTFVSVVGPYPEVSEKQTDYKVTVPDGVNLMRIIPGAGYGESAAVPVVWHWSNGEPVAENHANSNYVNFDGETCYVKAKYNDVEDICFVINSGGGNNLPDIRRIFMVNNSSALNDNLSVNRTLMFSQTDIFSPHVVCAVENADGDTPGNEYFTGGNHQTNNAGSGSAVTARSEGITVKCDGKTVDGGTYGNQVVVSWVNYIQGYNTSNAEGTGREIMKEEITLTITGTKVEVDVRHYAIEDIIRKTYYGLQMVCGAFAGARYIGGSNRAENACNAVSNSGDKKCRAISLFTENGDFLEIGIREIDLGSFEHGAKDYSAFMEATGKSYFSVIQNAEFEQMSGEMTTLRGYYHIMHK